MSLLRSCWILGFGYTAALAQLPAEPSSTPNPAPSPTPTQTPAAVETTPQLPTPLPDTAPSPPPLPTETGPLINLLNEAQVEKAIQALKAGYLQPSALSDRELERARLLGLTERLADGATLRPETSATPPREGHRFLAEILDGRFAYVRPAQINPTELAQFDAVLAGFTDQPIAALILDLRGIPYGADFDTAAEWTRRVAPKGRLLFRLEKPSAKQERIFTSNKDPVFSGTILVLIDERTAGAAEVVAGVLRRSTGALLFGQPTQGEPVEFATVPIGGGVEIKMAVAEAILGEKERAFPQGLIPDLPVSQDPALTEKIFQLSTEQGVSKFISEIERPRLNEAALVSRTNPEIEPTAPTTETLLDRPLQRAVDAAAALQFFGQPSANP
jgi:hypothetical protein